MDIPFVLVREVFGTTGCFGIVKATHQEMEHRKEFARWHEHMVSEPAEYVLITFMR